MTSSGVPFAPLCASWGLSGRRSRKPDPEAALGSPFSHFPDSPSPRFPVASCHHLPVSLPPRRAGRGYRHQGHCRTFVALGLPQLKAVDMGIKGSPTSPDHVSRERLPPRCSQFGSMLNDAASKRAVSFPRRLGSIRTLRNLRTQMTASPVDRMSSFLRFTVSPVPRAWVARFPVSHVRWAVSIWHGRSQR